MVLQFFPQNGLYKQLGEMRDKTVLSVRYDLVKILNGHGPILPLDPNLEQDLPILFSRLQENFYVQEERGNQGRVAGTAGDDDKGKKGGNSNHEEDVEDKEEEDEENREEGDEDEEEEEDDDDDDDDQGQEEGKKNDEGNGKEDEDNSKEEDNVDNLVVKSSHDASNMPVLLGAIVFLDAAFRYLANAPGKMKNDVLMHTFGIHWHRLHIGTKNMGTWEEIDTENVRKRSFKPALDWSLSETFGARVFVADEKESQQIKKLHSQWKKPKKATATRNAFDAYAAAVEECSMDLETFVNRLLYKARGSEKVVEVMKRCDPYLKSFGREHVLVGLVKYMGKKTKVDSYARAIAKGDKKAAVTLGIIKDDGGGKAKKKGKSKVGDGEEGDEDNGDDGDDDKPQKEKKHILSRTGEEARLFKRVYKTREKEILDTPFMQNMEKEDRVLSKKQHEECTRLAYLAVAMTNAEKSARDLARAAGAAESTVPLPQDPLSDAKLYDAVRNDELSGKGVCGDLAFFMMKSGYTAARYAVKQQRESQGPGIPHINYESAGNFKLPPGKVWTVQERQLFQFDPYDEFFLRREVLNGPVNYRQRSNREMGERGDPDEMKELQGEVEDLQWKVQKLAAAMLQTMDGKTPDKPFSREELEELAAEDEDDDDDKEGDDEEEESDQPEKATEETDQVEADAADALAAMADDADD